MNADSHETAHLASLNLIDKCATLAHERRYLEISDSMLRSTAEYDEGEADHLRRCRDEARAAVARPKPARRVAARAGGLTGKDLTLVMRAVGPPVREALAAQAADVEAKLARALQRIEALEQRKTSSGVRWAGTFETGHRYFEGELVTVRRGLWLCLAPTAEAPGTTPTDWRLICREGHSRP